MKRHSWLATLQADIEAICTNDPAIRRRFEVILYPGLHALIIYRIAHALWQHHWHFTARLLSQIARLFTSIDIHPGAQIGPGLFIDHGIGVVIGETSILGSNIVLHQGVTLGGTGKQRGKRHPNVEDGAVLGVNAVVLGAITIGKGAKIGGGAVVIKDVPAHATAVGVPARVVMTRDPLTGASQRVEHLPDPHGDTIRQLQVQVWQLQEQMREVLHHSAPAKHEYITIREERRTDRPAA